MLGNSPDQFFQAPTGCDCGSLVEPEKVPQVGDLMAQRDSRCRPGYKEHEFANLESPVREYGQ